MKKQCKTCGNSSESEYCFAHKPHKVLKQTKGFNKSFKINNEEKPKISEMNQFFLFIWNNKLPHKCYNCDKYLGNEPLSYMFDHILEKGIEKYKHLFLEKENICYLCLECHDNKTRGFLSEKLISLRDKTIQKLCTK